MQNNTKILLLSIHVVFRQIVWKSLVSVGCGVAKRATADGITETVIVARYKPQANIQNTFVANVMPLKPGGKDTLLLARKC